MKTDDCEALKIIEEFIRTSSMSSQSSSTHKIHSSTNDSLNKLDSNHNERQNSFLEKGKQQSLSNSESISTSFASSAISSSSPSSSSTTAYQKESNKSNQLSTNQRVLLASPTSPTSKTNNLLAIDQLYINLASQMQSSSPILRQKPNRPYSYYVATNLNPLDLSQFDQNPNEFILTEHAEEEEKPAMVRAKEQQDNKQSKPNRLSTSLFDLNQRKKNKKLLNKSSSSSTSNLNSSISKTTNKNKKQTHVNSEEYHSNPSKFNKFLRSIFRINTTCSNSDKLNSSQIHESSTGKFTRMFNSFRLNRHGADQTVTKTLNKKHIRPPNVTKQNGRAQSISTSSSDEYTVDSSINVHLNQPPRLVVMDDQPSKSLPLIQLSSLYSNKNELSFEVEEDDVNNRSLLSSICNRSTDLDDFKENFHLSVALKLKILASSSSCESSLSNSDSSSTSKTSNSSASNQVSSLSSIDSIDIPYIDEEIDSDYDYCEYGIVCDSQAPTKSISMDFKLRELIESVSEKNYADLAYECVNSQDLNQWQKIAKLLELTTKATQMVNQTDCEKLTQLKQLAANYIHNEYCEWIGENGGWKSVPVKNLESKQEFKFANTNSNERIH